MKQDRSPAFEVLDRIARLDMCRTDIEPDPHLNELPRLYAKNASQAEVLGACFVDFVHSDGRCV